MSELLKINVNEHVEKKNNLSYLSWAWAWAEVLKHDPTATWSVHEYPQPDGTVLPFMTINGTAMVKTTVKIHENVRSCLLPVMDHRNKAIKDPDAFAVNTAIMRCMTKAVSMHGLGLYIYAGEDLPEEDKKAKTEEDAKKRERQEGLEDFALYLIECHKAGRDLEAIEAWYDPASWTQGDEQEEHLFVWGLLKQESKLRSAIKSNKPEKLDAGAKDQDRAL